MILTPAKTELLTDPEKIILSTGAHEFALGFSGVRVARSIFSSLC